MNPAPSSEWAAPWTPNDSDRQSLNDWLYTHIPADPYNPMAYDSLGADGWAPVGRKLMSCSPDAFAALESQLAYTSYFAGIEAQALRNAQAADWHGEAADQYRHTLNKLPADLDHVSNAYGKALAALQTFADTSLDLKARFAVFQQDMETLQHHWNTALHATYPSEDVGGAAIRQLQNELTAKLADGQQILRNASYAFTDLKKVTDSLNPNPPGAVILAKGAYHALDGMYHDILSTPSAFTKFANNPGLSTGQNLVTDLSVDAAALVLLAGATTGVTEVAAGAGVLGEGTADSIIAVNSDIAAQATADGLDLGAAHVGLDLGQGKPAAAGISAVTLGFGFRGALKGDDLSEALDQISLVDRYEAELAAAGGDSTTALKLLGRDAKELKLLVPDYESPGAVEAWLNDAKSQLAHARIKAGLIKGPAKFVGSKAGSGAVQATTPQKPPSFPGGSGG